jgi:UDP-N-acetylglucosamine--N-acetylmuramyl-(pentapeptide) pyrophosphoryl-undecaprenol N-acetylglucosamine transferase
VTGCPIRDDIRSLPSREDAARRLGLNPILNTLVVTGASQGAQTVNEAVLDAVRGMSLAGWQILHLSGKDHASAVRQGYRDINIEAMVVDFTPAMADVWAAATVVVSRAGASSCAELCACGLPSILMPYPYHKDMHQRANARVLADAGAAMMLDDQKDRAKNGAALKPVLEQLINDANKRNEMSLAARTLARPDAADAVAGVMMELLASDR